MKKVQIRGFVALFSALNNAGSLLDNQYDIDTLDDSIISLMKKHDIESVTEILSVLQDYDVQTVLDEVEGNFYNYTDKAAIYVTDILRQLADAAQYLGSRREGVTYGRHIVASLKFFSERWNEGYVDIPSQRNEAERYLLKCKEIWGYFFNGLDGLCLNFGIDIMKVQRDAGLNVYNRGTASACPIYHEYKKQLDEIWMNESELDGMLHDAKEYFNSKSLENKSFREAVPDLLKVISDLYPLRKLQEQTDEYINKWRLGKVKQKMDFKTPEGVMLEADIEFPDMDLHNRYIDWLLGYFREDTPTVYAFAFDTLVKIHNQQYPWDLISCPDSSLVVGINNKILLTDNDKPADNKKEEFQLPKALESDDAKRLFQEIVKLGYCAVDGNIYQWTGKFALFGYFVDKVSDYLSVRQSNDRIPWKIFKEAFQCSDANISTAKQAVNDYKNKGLSEPEGFLDIKRLCV